MSEIRFLDEIRHRRHRWEHWCFELMASHILGDIILTGAPMSSNLCPDLIFIRSTAAICSDGETGMVWAAFTWEGHIALVLNVRR